MTDTLQEIDDGGPAFPFTPNQQLKLSDGTWDQNTDFGEPGMSTRMWLAGMAMQGILSSLESVEVKNALADEARACNETISEFTAACAYKIADAMIAASRKDTQQ